MSAGGKVTVMKRIFQGRIVYELGNIVYMGSRFNCSDSNRMGLVDSDRIYVRDGLVRSRGLF